MNTVPPMIIITARRSYASAVLGVVILSVCRSVHLSHVCFVTNPKNLLAIFLYHILITANMQSETGFPSSHCYCYKKSYMTCGVSTMHMVSTRDVFCASIQSSDNLFRDSWSRNRATTLTAKSTLPQAGNHQAGGQLSVPDSQMPRSQSTAVTESPVLA